MGFLEFFYVSGYVLYPKNRTFRFIVRIRDRRELCYTTFSVTHGSELFRAIGGA